MALMKNLENSSLPKMAERGALKKDRESTLSFQEIEKYLNAVDFSMVSDPSVLKNIYNEILPFSSELAKSPISATSLETLIGLSNAEMLIMFLESLDRTLIYKKLGSRIFEKIYKRLFECVHIGKENISFRDSVDWIDFRHCLTNENATHVVRAVFKLISGKKIKHSSIIRYKVRTECGNKEYSECKLKEISRDYMDKIGALSERFEWSTMAVFIQCSYSQSLIREIIEKKLNFDHIIETSFLYEVMPAVASRKSNEMIYQKIKGDIMKLSMDERGNYFVQSFLRHGGKAINLLRRIDVGRFDEESRVLLSLIEGLQSENMYDEVVRIIEDRYVYGESLFSTFLLNRYEDIDTKYLNVVKNFMGIPKKYNFGVNEDFVKNFDKEWVTKKPGIELMIGYIEGSDDRENKERFVEDNVDCFWKCRKWREADRFLVKVLEYSKGYAKKKAKEIYESMVEDKKKL